MDETFRSGKFKGRWFSDVACQETAFCSWAKRQKTPPGYLRSFVDFLRAGSAGRRGQRSMDAFVTLNGASAAIAGVPAAAPTAESSRAPEKAMLGAEGGLGDGLSRRRLDFTLVLAVTSKDEFDVGPMESDAEVPHTISVALGGHPAARSARDVGHWRFGAEAYADVLQWLECNPSFRCRVEPVPMWVLWHLPAFAPSASRVRGVAKLQLSSATRMLLADLPRPPVAKSSPAAAAAGSGTLGEGSAVRHLGEPDVDGLGGKLLPFQMEAVKLGLVRGGRMLLGDEMGLGKTITALALARQYRDEWPFLVVAPSPLCNVWKEHALAWLPSELGEDDVFLARASCDVAPIGTKLMIVPYTLMGEPKFQQRPGIGGDFSMVVLDECHLLRGAGSKRVQAVVPLAKRARRALLLSGTPLVSRAEDAYPLFEILLAGSAPSSEGASTLNGLSPESSSADLPSIAEFMRRYKETRIFGSQESGPRPAASCVKFARPRTTVMRNYNELNSLLGTIMVRRLKADVLSQLPPKRRQRIYLELPNYNRKAIVAGADASFGGGDGQAQMDAAGDKEKHACDALCDLKIVAVVDYVRCLVAMGTKFLVFAHHLRMLDGLERSLQGEPVGYIRIDGGTPSNARTEAVSRFQNDDGVRVALLSLTACCQGLTLNAASVVVFAELFWVPGVLLQAEDRVHRLGQRSAVDIHYLVARGTVDERMFRAATRRALDTARVVDGEADREDTEAPLACSDASATYSPAAWPAGALSCAADSSSKATRKRSAAYSAVDVELPKYAGASHSRPLGALVLCDSGIADDLELARTENEPAVIAGCMMADPPLTPGDTTLQGGSSADDVELVARSTGKLRRLNWASVRSRASEKS